jgi:hypothetical protein
VNLRFDRVNFVQLGFSEVVSYIKVFDTVRLGFLSYYSQLRDRTPKLKPVIRIYWKSKPGKEVWGDF